MLWQIRNREPETSGDATFEQNNTFQICLRYKLRSSARCLHYIPENATKLFSPLKAVPERGVISRLVPWPTSTPLQPLIEQLAFQSAISRRSNDGAAADFRLPDLGSYIPTDSHETLNRPSAFVNELNSMPFQARRVSAMLAHLLSASPPGRRSNPDLTLFRLCHHGPDSHSRATCLVDPTAPPSRTGTACGARGLARSSVRSF